MTTCQCESCCPENPGATYTRAHMLACEARRVCRIPTREERAGYLADVEKFRGKDAADALRTAVRKEFDNLLMQEMPN